MTVLQITLPIIIAANAVTLITLLAGLIFIMRWSMKYTFALGDTNQQDFYRRRITRLLVFLLFLAIISAAFNLLLT